MTISEKRLEPDECDLCGGTGEVMAATLRDQHDQIPCPSCVAQDLHERISCLQSAATQARGEAKTEEALKSIEAQLGNWLYNAGQQVHSPPDSEAVTRCLKALRQTARDGLGLEGPGT